MGVLNGLLDGGKPLMGSSWGVADCAVNAYLAYLPMFFPDLDLSPYPAVQANIRQVAAALVPPRRGPGLAAQGDGMLQLLPKAGPRELFGEERKIRRCRMASQARMDALPVCRSTPSAALAPHESRGTHSPALA